MDEAQAMLIVNRASHKLRTFLTMLGIMIGIASVILLTSIGEGTRQYILSEFSQFGTTIVAVNPGKVETMGIAGVIGGTVRHLTLGDTRALWSEKTDDVELAFHEMEVALTGPVNPYASAEVYLAIHGTEGIEVEEAKLLLDRYLPAGLGL